MVTRRDNPRSLESGSEVVEVEVDGGGETLRARRSGFDSVDYDPSGNLYGIGDPAPDYPYVFSLWRLDEPPVDITGHLDRSLNDLLTSGALERPIWLEDGFLASIADRGRASVVAFGPGRRACGRCWTATGTSRASRGPHPEGWLSPPPIPPARASSTS